MEDRSRGISVVVCCYNSAKRLDATLGYLAKQEVGSGIPWEVIVVDNASKDNTASEANRIWKELNGVSQFRVVHEPMAGLSNARRKGYECALYDYLIFCDDDNWLEVHYVAHAFHIITAADDIGIVGGRITAAYDAVPEPWIKDHEDLLAVGPRADIANGEIPAAIGLVYGAGMVIRKSIFTRVQQYRYSFLLSDRQGNVLSSCGDSELCFIARLMGFRIFFSNDLKLVHNIPTERMEWGYFKKLIYGFGFSGILLLPYIYALHGKPVKGFEKIRTHWLWQLASIYKQLLQLRIPGGKGGKQQQLDYEEKRGRADGLWKLRGKYRMAFEQVEGLLHQINQHD